MKKGLNDREKFCLAGYSVTRDADTAYQLARGGKKNASDTSLHRMALRWVRSRQAQDFLKEISTADLHPLSNEQDIDRDKQSVIHELNILASQSKDPKERSAILMKLADLQNMRETPIARGDDLKVQYYLPVRYPTSCQDCLLRINGVSSIEEAKEKARQVGISKTHRNVTLQECWGKKPKDTF